MRGLRNAITKRRIRRLMPATITLLQRAPTCSARRLERAVDRKNTTIIAMKMPMKHSISIAMMLVSTSAKVSLVYSYLYSARALSRCHSVLAVDLVLSDIFSVVSTNHCADSAAVCYPNRHNGEMLVSLFQEAKASVLQISLRYRL